MNRPSHPAVGNNRMMRVLVCLVISMTAGALCLDWLRPDRSVPRGAGIPLIARTPWQGIRIERQLPRTDAGLVDAHFVINRDGRYVNTPSWMSQRPLGAIQVIRIGLLSEDANSSITPAQQDSAAELVRWLQGKYGISDEQVVWSIQSAGHRPS